MPVACAQPPVDWEAVWEGRGTERAFTLWRMLPPPGYVALGFVVTVTRCDRAPTHRLAIARRSAAELLARRQAQDPTNRE